MGCCAPASVLLEEGSTRSRRDEACSDVVFCTYSLQSLFASLPFFRLRFAKPILLVDLTDTLTRDRSFLNSSQTPTFTLLARV